MEIKELIREFTYNGVKLADPNTAFTLVQVRDFYSTVYPEIISADIDGPNTVGAKSIYTFRRAVGTKGRGVTGRSLLADLAALARQRKMSEPDAIQVLQLQQLAAPGGELTASQGMLLVGLQRRYLPALAS